MKKIFQFIKWFKLNIYYIGISQPAWTSQSEQSIVGHGDTVMPLGIVLSPRDFLWHTNLRTKLLWLTCEWHPPCCPCILIYIWNWSKKDFLDCSQQRWHNAACYRPQHGRTCRLRAVSKDSHLEPGDPSGQEEIGTGLFIQTLGHNKV